jgi:phosphosulfolactate phosphohydrolase-like enzyme
VLRDDAAGAAFASFCPPVAKLDVVAAAVVVGVVVVVAAAAAVVVLVVVLEAVKLANSKIPALVTGEKPGAAF